MFAIRTPVAIAVGVRYAHPQPETPAKVRYTRIDGKREEKLAQLAAMGSFGGLEWKDCFEGWMEPFLPTAEGDYFSWPLLTDLFPWQHSGVQFKRTWPIGETKEVLLVRWRALLRSNGLAQAAAFRETRDRKIDQAYPDLRHPTTTLSCLQQLEHDVEPLPIVRYAYRSFDRRWTLVDSRLGDFMRPALWAAHGPRQVYLTSLLSGVLGTGPAATACAKVPDLDHFRGAFGAKHVIPLYRDALGRDRNIAAGLLDHLATTYGGRVLAEDLFAYCYGLLATPAYVEHFSEELTIPGPRLPLTKDRTRFRRTVEFGRRLVFLHTFGERLAPDPIAALPHGHARCTMAIPSHPDRYPESFHYNASTQTLEVGEGAFAPVEPAVFELSVSGLQVVKSWLSYRMKNGAGRRSSPLDHIRPERWTAEMTDEFLELLWVLEATVELFPALTQNRQEVLATDLFRADELPQPSMAERKPPKERAGQQHSQAVIE